MHQNNLPLLTIGLPFFNSEGTLANSLKSVMLQSFQNWELILVDDGSNDRSCEIAKEFTRMDGRIKLITDGVNRGISYRLNQVIDMANGDYIARMDADDMMMPDRIEKQLNALLADRSIDIIDTASYIINENEEPIGVRGTWDIGTRDRKKYSQKAFCFIQRL
ncbi:MAG: glycosyltransferase family 2 protein [Chitinophagaceae bacterium]|nr:glycosyltransferase family 2 protein [Chitinophagaceae bacterium]